MLGTRSNEIDTNSRAVTHSRAVFIASSVYAVTIIATTLTLNFYFSQTWDVKTFIQAAHRFLDGGNPFDLYSASRAAQTWPYAYPPLHAFVTAMFVWIGTWVTILPDYVWARIPVVIADIALGLLLYAIIVRRSNDESRARTRSQQLDNSITTLPLSASQSPSSLDQNNHLNRVAALGMLLWLFNPVTFYNTAVQGHFESEWLVFIALAYYWHENSRGIILPTIALAMAVLFKQIAILFAIPFWVSLTISEIGKRKDKNLHPSSFILHPLLSLALFAFVTIIVCLPYLLYSNDFIYMNLTYVENVPVQTQSWVVALLALTRPARDAMTSDFFFLRYNTFISMLASLAISFFAVRRGWSLWLTGTLIAIAFFLISRKAMGYYYVMLFPFLLAEFLPRQKFGTILAAILLASYISLSPYYAPWVNLDHIWIYAMLGTINSALWVWMFVKMTNERTQRTEKTFLRPSSSVVLFITLGLFISAAIAALLQPFAPQGGSPIRVPLIAPGAEPVVLAAFIAMLALTVIGLGLLSRQVREVSGSAWVIVLAFAPLFFMVYYLTKESTAAFEWLLKLMGA